MKRTITAALLASTALIAQPSPELPSLVSKTFSRAETPVSRVLSIESKSWSQDTVSSHYRYLYSYDGNSLDSIYTQNRVDDSWETYEFTDYDWAAERKVNSFKSFTIDSAGTISPKDSTEYFLNDAFTSLTEMTTFSWNGTSWDTTSCSLWEFDSKGEQSAMTFIYPNSSKRHMRYENGLEVSDSSFVWEENSWKTRSFSKYTYRDSLKISTLSGYNGNSGWDYDSTALRYDSRNRLIETVDFTEDSAGGWSNYRQVLYGYTDSDSVSEETSLYWRDEQWEKSSKLTHEYENGNLVKRVSYSWRDSVWENSYRYLYEYENDKVILEQNESWTSESTWENKRKYVSEYDQWGNNSFRASFVWDSTGWKEKSWIRYTYEASPSGISEGAVKAGNDMKLTGLAQKAGTVELSLTLAQQQNVAVSLYQVNGKKVGTLFEGIVPVGGAKLSMDHSRFAAGLYIVKVTSGSKQIHTGKLNLLK